MDEAYDALPVSVLVFGRLGAGYALEHANPEAERAFSAKSADMEGKSPAELAGTLGESIAAGLAAFSAAMAASPGTPAAADFEGSRESGGRERCHLVKARALPGGGRDRFSACLIDISDRKTMERTLRYSLAQAQASNRELEEFAYAASHDLKEPLRVVSSFLGLIGRKYGEALEGKGKEWIARTDEAAARMAAMIDGLLELSRASAVVSPMATFPADRALGRALDSLRVLVAERGASVERGPLPEIYGDEAQIARLFQNLLENAVKYARPGEAPRIRVRSEAGARCARVIFSDSGIGIPEQMREKVFEPFRRLHSREEYPGTGLGLATCRKIAEKNCASIKAEGNAEGGSDFVVEFPLSKFSR